MLESFPPILVICGPTASGKTSLAISIAKQLSSSRMRGSIPSSLRVRQPACRQAGLTPPHSVHILSADSRQVYQGLGILTGKDIPQDLPQSIKFFGLNIVNPSENFNLSDYVAYARQVIENSLSSKTPLIIVGGTGLYLQAITSSLPTVQVPPNQKLRTRLEKLDLATLQKQLAKINPEKFSSLNNSDANNPRRLIRAIEISMYKPSLRDSYSNQSNQEKSSSLRGGIPTWQSHSTLSLPPTFHWVGLKQDKEVQKENIKKRVLDRLKNGAIREVQNLQKKYPNLKLPIYSSLGVKQIMAYQNKKITYDKLLDLWSSAENDYARRQMVWFKKQPGIIWYDIHSESPSAQKLAKVITTK